MHPTPGIVGIEIVEDAPRDLHPRDEQSGPDRAGVTP